MANGKYKNISLSLIVPAYNEEGNIKNAVQTNLRTLSELGVDYELIVVNDGSTDQTLHILEENFTGKDRIKIHSKSNGGFGSAVKRGIELASGQYIIFAPVDNPLTPPLLETFLSRIGQADVLVSYRLDRKGYSRCMKFKSSIYQILISKLFGLPLKDFNWIHLYKKSIFDDMDIKNDGIFMLAEVLIKAHWKGYAFSQFPVEMQERNIGIKTSATLRAALRTAWDLIRFYLFYLKHRPNEKRVSH